MTYYTALRKAYSIISLTLLPFVFFVFLSYLFEFTRRGGLLYSSDMAHLFLLVGDLLKDPTALFSWYHSPALYTFPDWFLGALVVAAPIPSNWLPLMYGALLMSLYSLVGGALLATTGEAGPGTGAWMIAAMLVCGALAALAFNTPVSTGLYVNLAAAFVHTGAALATLAAAALFLHLLQAPKPKSIAAFVGLGALTFAASFSDLLFSAWFVGPACITGLLYAGATRHGRGVVLAALLIAAAFGGWAIQRMLHDIGAKYMADSPGSLSSSAKLLHKVLTLSRDSLDLPFLLLSLATLALLLRGLMLILRLIRRQTPNRGQVMEILLAGICAAAMLAPVAANMLYDLGSLRYFVILALVPLVWVGYHALRVATGKPLHRLISMIPAILLFLSALIAVPAWDAAKRLAAPRSLQVCLEQQGRTAGFGGYWTAKELMLRSDRRIHIVQLRPNGTAYRWNTNERWFSSRADNGAPLKLDFIIPRRLDKESLSHTFGLPNSVITCGGNKIWLYDKPLAVPQ